MKRWTLVTSITVGAVLGAAGISNAAWTGTSVSAGKAGGKATHLNPPATVSTTTVSASAIDLTVSAGPASGPVPTGYRIDRLTPSAATGICGGLGPSGGTCHDTGRSANTAYAYGFRSLRNSWVSGPKTALGKTTYSATFYTSGISLTNKTGGTVGQLELGDQLVVTFNATPHYSTICSSFSSDTSGQTFGNGSGTNGSFTVTLKNDAAPNTGDDLLQFTTDSNACGGSLHVGTVDLGSKSFVTGGDVTFQGTGNNATTLTSGGSANTLTIKLGSPHLGTGAASGTDAGTNVAIYTPDSGIKNKNQSSSIAGNGGAQAVFF